MPLTTEGLIEELQRFRSDKLALVALVGSMAEESEAQALVRLRELIGILENHLTEARSKHRGRLGDADHLASDVLGLAKEIEPWLSSLVERSEKVAC